MDPISIFLCLLTGAAFLTLEGEDLKRSAAARRAFFFSVIVFILFLVSVWSEINPQAEPKSNKEQQSKQSFVYPPEPQK